MRAWTRAIPDSFTRALARDPQPIDVTLARKQHAAYVEALRATGLAVHELPAEEEFPDGCFVEDTMLVAKGVALATRPGAPSRRGEVSSLEKALRPFFKKLERVEAPATLEGGDCLVAGDRILVGISHRTNAAGAARVREVFGPLGFTVVLVPVPEALHLKCACSSLGGGRVLLAEGALPDEAFAGLSVLRVPASEGYAANVVAVGKHVLVAAGYPRTRELLERAGFTTHVLENSETKKADGSLTCCSIIDARESS